MKFKIGDRVWYKLNTLAEGKEEGFGIIDNCSHPDYNVRDLFYLVELELGDELLLECVYNSPLNQALR